MNKINTFRVALGTVSYCKTCRALLLHGVNSAEAMNAVSEITGRPTFGANWAKVLDAHEAYHKAKGEELPVEFTSQGLSEDFKSKLVPPKPKPRVKKEMSEEEALAAFLTLAGKEEKQRNGRRDNRPIIAKIDKAPLK
jgi:hypothetical protein